MSTIEIIVKNAYENFSNSEKKVADYFLENINNIFHLPIRELAEESGVSQVAWVRFAKVLGFNGLKDLKKKLFDEVNINSETTNKSTKYFFKDIKDFTSIENIAESIEKSSIKAIEDSFKLTDLSIILKIVDLINSANTIKIFGIGASAIVAQDFHNKLLRIGLNSCFSNDFHIQLTYAANLDVNDIGFFISNSGKTKEIIELIDITLKNKCKTISLTKFNKNPLANKADFNLFASSPEFSLRSGATSSRIAQLTILDLLFTAIANKNYEKIKIKLENSYESCKNHRLD